MLAKISQTSACACPGSDHTLGSLETNAARCGITRGTSVSESEAVPSQAGHRREAILRALVEKQDQLLCITRSGQHDPERHGCETSKASASCPDGYPGSDTLEQGQLAEHLGTLHLSPQPASSHAAASSDPSRREDLGSDAAEDAGSSTLPTRTSNSHLQSRLAEAAQANARLRWRLAELEHKMALQSELAAARAAEADASEARVRSISEQLQKAQIRVGEQQERGRIATMAAAREQERARDLEDELDAAEEREARVYTLLEKTEERLAVALYDLDFAQQETARAEHKTRSLEETGRELHNEKVHMERRLTVLVGELASARSVGNELKACALNHAQLEQQVRASTAHAAQLEGEARAAQAACAQWQQQATALQSQIEALRQEFEAATADSDRLQYALDAALQERDVANAQAEGFSQREARLECESAESAEKADELARELEDVKAALASANDKLVKADELYWDTKEELAATQEELEERSDELENLTSQMTQLQATALALENGRNALRDELASFEQRMAQLNANDVHIQPADAVAEANSHTADKQLATAQQEQIEQLTARLLEAHRHLEHSPTEVESLCVSELLFFSPLDKADAEGFRYRSHPALAAQFASQTASKVDLPERIRIMEEDLQAQAMEIEQNDDRVLQLKRRIKKLEAERVQLHARIAQLDRPTAPAPNILALPPSVAGKKRPLPEDVDASPRAADRRHHVRTLCMPLPRSLEPLAVESTGAARSVSGAAGRLSFSDSNTLSEEIRMHSDKSPRW